MKQLAKINIPLYIAALVLLFVSGVIVLIALYFHVTIYNYDIFLPSEPPTHPEFTYGSWPALQNTDFYQTVKDEVLKTGGSLIEVNVASKTLWFYDNGALVRTIPVLATGKAGSWWETPTGLYKIQGKERDHYSSFAGVHMPWSLPFQGNFFIHGWPYYPDGAPVNSSYSGGCIRLSDDDAKFLYNTVKIGTPVLVQSGDVGTDRTSYTFRTPAISARSVFAGDLLSNFVFLSQSSTEAVPIASVTKLVTALVAAEYINLDKTIIITKEMIIPTSKPRLWVGEKLRAFDLMYPLLLESSNEAAAALAETVGTDLFVTYMNDKAKALGMDRTKFVDAAGVGEGNISTAEDVFMLLRHLVSSRSFFLRLTSGKLSKDLPHSTLFAGLENFNLFSGRDDFLGGKMGKSSAAGETMASVFEVNDGTGGVRPVGIVVLGSSDVGKDTDAILSYIKQNFKAQWSPAQ
jgi:hypothetical protein